MDHTLTAELKDASTLIEGQNTGQSADHATLASGIASVVVNASGDRILIRFGSPALSDLYLSLNLAAAHSLASELANAIDWLENPNA